MRNFDLNDVKQIIDSPDTYQSTGDIFLDNRYDEPQHETHLYYRFFYHLAKYLQPNFMVELGGWQGTAAAHFAVGWPDATVITIDHHTDSGDNLNKARMIEASGKYPNLHYIQGWTNDTLAQREKGRHALGDAYSASPEVMEFDKEIDILFIDSWHQYKEAMLDWEIYSLMLSSPSLVICDDIIGGHGPAIGGMLDFWNELPGDKFLNDTLHPGYPMGFLRYEIT